MRCLLLLTSVLLVALCTNAIPCEPPATEPTTTTSTTTTTTTTEAPCKGDDEVPKPTVGYRKETIDKISNSSTVANTNTESKAKQTIKVKERKDGTTVTVIKDTSRNKTKSDEINKTYDQTNRTLIENGIKDSTSATKETESQKKSVDVVKQKKKEVIVTDASGKVISDTTKTKVSEKSRTKESSKQSETLVHTVSKADASDIPVCDKEPTSTTTTTTTTTTEAPEKCGCSTTTTEAPVKCGCSTTTTEAPVKCGS